MAETRLDVTEMPFLSGCEEILTGVTVRDFWAWALGDLRLNSTRGVLAQFLVAKALGDSRPRDDGWGNFDVLTAEGTKVEVKSSGYLQSWQQSQPSRIVFSGLKARSWDDTSGYSANAEYRADIYVFAVHTCQNPSLYDPLDVHAWTFYVLPAQVVRMLGQKSLSLPRLAKIAPTPVALSELKEAVQHAVDQVTGVRVDETK